MESAGKYSEGRTGTAVMGWAFLVASAVIGYLIVNGSAEDGEPFNWVLFSFFGAAGIVALAVCCAANSICYAIKQTALMRPPSTDTASPADTAG